MHYLTLPLLLSILPLISCSPASPLQTPKKDYGYIIVRNGGVHSCIDRYGDWVVDLEQCGLFTSDEEYIKPGAFLSCQCSFARVPDWCPSTSLPASQDTLVNVGLLIYPILLHTGNPYYVPGGAGSRLVKNDVSMSRLVSSELGICGIIEWMGRLRFWCGGGLPKLPGGKPGNPSSKFPPVRERKDVRYAIPPSTTWYKGQFGADKVPSPGRPSTLYLGTKHKLSGLELYFERKTKPGGDLGDPVGPPPSKSLKSTRPRLQMPAR